MKKKLDRHQVTAIIDTREQTPWVLPAIGSVRGSLTTGDYSLAGFESEFTIERKSLEDFIGCVGRERSRFERELHRLSGFRVGMVIIEADWHELEQGQWRGKISPNMAIQSLLSWIASGHQIILAGNRLRAAAMASDIIFHFARDRWIESYDFLKSVGG